MELEVFSRWVTQLPRAISTHTQRVHLPQLVLRPLVQRLFMVLLRVIAQEAFLPWAKRQVFILPRAISIHMRLAQIQPVVLARQAQHLLMAERLEIALKVFLRLGILAPAVVQQRETNTHILIALVRHAELEPQAQVLVEAMPPETVLEVFLLCILLLSQALETNILMRVAHPRQ